MNIEYKCSCGASIRLEDDKGVFIKAGGDLDEQGRKYLIEVKADLWLAQHSMHTKI